MSEQRKQVAQSRRDKSAIRVRNDVLKRSDKVLAEFSALRSEIEYRTNAQLALITLNLTAVGAVAGFALKEPSLNSLIALLALVSPALGLLWVDHAITIDNIGDYIRKKLGFKWEMTVERERKKFFRRLLFVGQIILLFAAPSIAAMSYLHAAHAFRCCGFPNSLIEWGLLGGWVLTSAFIGRLVWFLIEPRWGGD